MTFEEDKYIKVGNMISKDICEMIELHALEAEQTNPNTTNIQVPGSHEGYKDIIMESLLYHLKPKMEKATGLKLIPTYSFYRIYRNGHVLNDHKDRPACEISVTIPIGFKFEDRSPEYRWPLCVYVGDMCRYLTCDIGEGVIYKGCELMHGRELLITTEGSYQIQVFLHYVDAEGPFTMHADDSLNK